jgi:membrane associated rhomboid family serine protease
MAKTTASGQATTVIAILTGAVQLLLFVTGFLGAASLIAGFIPLRLSALASGGGVVADFTMLPVLLTPLSATFVHGGWLHLGMNLLMLLYCGKQVEVVLGQRRLVLLYVAGAYAAALTQWAAATQSTAPMIGASGAISAVIATYAVLYSQQAVRALGPIPAGVVRILWLAAGWIGLQLLLGLASGPGTGFGLVAIPAHIGGFIIGLLLTRPLLRSRFRGAGRLN